MVFVASDDLQRVDTWSPAAFSGGVGLVHFLLNSSLIRQVPPLGCHVPCDRLVLHRDAIEVLHLIGAHDDYIARQFASRALGLGIHGGILGLVLALPTLWMLAHLASSLDERLLPNIGFGPWHWLLLLVMPVSVALIAMTTAKVTVMRNLSRML